MGYAISIRHGVETCAGVGMRVGASSVGFVEGTQGPTPSVPPAPLPPPPAKPKGPQRRLILVLVAGIVGLLCLGGASVVFLLYEKATRIDRSTPDAVVDNYLRAYLVVRDDKEAAEYTCGGVAAFPEIQALRADVVSREQTHSMTVNFSWTRLDVQSSGQTAMVTTDVQRAVSDGTERLADRWSFTLEDADGWRVCGASQVS